MPWRPPCDSGEGVALEIDVVAAATQVQQAAIPGVGQAEFKAGGVGLAVYAGACADGACDYAVTGQGNAVGLDAGASRARGEVARCQRRGRRRGLLW